MSCIDCKENKDEFNKEYVLLHAYRVTDTISERNRIPCNQRLRGMLVTVIGKDESFKSYMLKGKDICSNDSWELFQGFKQENAIDHVTIQGIPSPYETKIVNLNQTYPDVKEGFRITYPDLETTFTKIAGNKWVTTNSFKINEQ